MRIESLRTLLRFRHLNVDAAKHGLAQALAAESIAASASSRAELRIAEEAEAALSSAGDDAVERYARWLTVGREQARRLRADLTRASQEVTLARSALVLARSEELAAEVSLERLEIAAAFKEGRKAQDELDEAGARCARA